MQLQCSGCVPDTPTDDRDVVHQERHDLAGRDNARMPRRTNRHVEQGVLQLTSLADTKLQQCDCLGRCHGRGIEYQVLDPVEKRNEANGSRGLASQKDLIPEAGPSLENGAVGRVTHQNGPHDVLQARVQEIGSRREVHNSGCTCQRGSAAAGAGRAINRVDGLLNGCRVVGRPVSFGAKVSDTAVHEILGVGRVGVYAIVLDLLIPVSVSGHNEGGGQAEQQSQWTHDESETARLEKG